MAPEWTGDGSRLAMAPVAQCVGPLSTALYSSLKYFLQLVEVCFAARLPVHYIGNAFVQLKQRVRAVRPASVCGSTAKSICILAMLICAV